MPLHDTELLQRTDNQALPGMTEPEAMGPPDPIEVAREEAACDRALAHLRAFSVNDEVLRTFWQDAQHYPDRPSCNAFYLAAQWLYNEQLKSYLDQRLESDAKSFTRKFQGTLEAESIRNLLSIMSDYSSEKEVQEADEFFSQAAAQHRGRQDIHFRILAQLAKLKVTQMRLLAGGYEGNKLRQYL